MNKNTKSAREVPLARKESIFQECFPVINTIHTLSSDNMMLRSQLRQLVSSAYHLHERNIDFMIAEMLNNGLLYSKSVSVGSKTEILYLSKFTVGKIMETSSANVPAIAFSRKKIFENIFATEYLVSNILPKMQGEFETSPENVINYLYYNASNLLITSHQLYYSDYFEYFRYTTNRLGIALTDEFLYDLRAYYFDKLNFLKKTNPDLTEECNLYKKDKQIRESICQTYMSNIERTKYTYSLANMMANRYYITSLEKTAVNLIHFDSLDNLSLEKLYLNLAGIVHMIDRYCSKELKINLTVYVWSQGRADNFYNQEDRRVFDYFTKTYKDTPRSDSFLANFGVRPSLWDNINVSYLPCDIANKYHVIP